MKNKNRNVSATRDRLVCNKVVAEILNVTPNTVMNWTKKEKIPGILVGSVYRYHIPSLAADLKIPAAVIDAYFSS